MTQDIIKKIEAMLPSLSAKHKIIAVAIIQDPLTTSFVSAKELSDKIHVSPATIIRFAQLVTGEGYPELQKALQEHVHTITNPISRMQLQFESQSKDDDLLARIYETQLDNLRRVFNQGLLQAITQSYELISKAAHVSTYGSRGSFSIAYFLGRQLSRAIGNTSVISDNDILADSIYASNEKDVAIFFCMSRYSTRLLTAARLLHEKGCKVISINDSTNSPFVPISDVTFFAPASSSDFHNSEVASMLIAELLVSFIISKKYTKTIDSLKEYETYFKELNQFYED